MGIFFFSRFRFLDEARNSVEHTNSEQLDIVILPPTDGPKHRQR